MSTMLLRIKFSLAFRTGTCSNQAALKNEVIKHINLVKFLSMSSLTAVKLFSSELQDINHNLPNLACTFQLPWA